MSIFFEDFLYKKSSRQKPTAFFWRCGWDSNPRYREVQLISSQSRYDHFDTTPYMLNSRKSITNYSIVSFNGTSPVMSCCGIPKKSSHPLALDFVRPRPLLFARFFCHWQRSQTSPLRYHTVLTKLRIIAITSTAILL